MCEFPDVWWTLGKLVVWAWVTEGSGFADEFADAITVIKIYYYVLQQYN